MDGAGRCGLGEFSIRWARIRNSRTPAGFRPNGLPLGQQSRCRLGTFEPAKSKGGWMGLDAVAWVNFPSGGHASETAEPQQDSGPTGCHWVSSAAAVWAPSNPLKAKVDGWGWTLQAWVNFPRIRNSRTPAGFRPNGLPLGQQSRCRLGTFEPAKSKGGWMGLDAVAWVNFPSGGHASETAEPQQDSGPTGCHWVSRAAAVWAPSNPLKAKVDGWGWTLWPG